MMFLSTYSTLFAQKWYVSIGSGYKFGMSKQGISNIEGGSTIYNFESNTNTGVTASKAISASFGAGFDINTVVGYTFSKNISIELATKAHISDKINAHFNDIFGATSNYEFQAKMISFEPTFVVSAGYQKINPYLKFGPIFGFGTIKLDNDMLVPFSDGSFKHYETSFRMCDGFAFGIHSAVGILHQINKKWQVFVEVNANNLSYSPSKGSYSKYTIDNQEYVGVLDSNFINFDYVNEINSLDNQDLTKPHKVLKTDYPFGSLGFDFGLKYFFK